MGKKKLKLLYSRPRFSTQRQPLIIGNKSRNKSNQLYGKRNKNYCTNSPILSDL